MYELVTHQGLSQAAVGRAFGRTQARVSQVCRRVREYLALAEPVDAEPLAELDEQEESRLAKLELIAQKEELRTHALRAVRWGEEEAKTQKQVVRDEAGRVLEEVRMTSPRGNLRAIREASRQCDELAELRGVVVRRGSGRGVRGSGKEVGDRKPAEEARQPATQPRYQMPWHLTPDCVPPLCIPLASDPGTYTAYRPEIYYAIEFRLSKVADGSATLAEIETSIHRDAQNRGWMYPSLFEKCAESINGVRVADWVREHVPEERLPHGEELWLPMENNLAGFDGAEREVIEVDTSARFYNPGERAWRFGGRRGAENRGERTGDRGQETAEASGGRQPTELAGDGGQTTADSGHSFNSHFATPLAASGASQERGASTGAKLELPLLVVPPTRLERLLARGRVRSGVARRVLERVVRQRRAK
jgi:hypothetical protein